jgi:phage N-6-adenine-methyltransferase
MGDLVPVSELERQIAQPMPAKKRATLTKVLQRCVEIKKLQDNTHRLAFDYAKLLCDNERMLGKELTGTVTKGGDKRWHPKSEIPTLDSIGISKDRSHAAQRMAKVPAAKYECWLDGLRVEDEKGRIDVPTLDGLYHLYGNPPISQNTGQDEWYTPAKYLDSARKVMGSIDLDPASSKDANKTVQATFFYTSEDSGLQHGWSGNVWLNPPFSMLLEFSEKLTNEVSEGVDVTQAVMLGPNYSDSGWWQMCAEYASAICHTNHRIRFVSPKTGEVSKDSPTNGHTFFYFGKRNKSFSAEFEQWGITR